MERYGLRPGMYVLSIDGQKLGRLARLRDDALEVVAGRRKPLGFDVPLDEVASTLRGEIFLRQRLRDYEDRYEPRDEPAPRLLPAQGRRFHIFRHNEARW